MRSLIFASLAACLVGGLARPANEDGLTTLVEARNDRCATGLHMIVGGGCMVPCALDSNGLLGHLVNSLKRAIPGSNQYLVPYDNSSAYFQIVSATNLMVAHAKNYSAMCPTTPIAFLGYSLGGIIVMNSICNGNGIGPSYTNKVIGIVTYGEETFSYPQSYDRGNCTSNAPNNGARGNTAGCYPYSAVMRDYCNANDPKCCSTGTDMKAHYSYPGLYDSANIQFITSQYAAYRNGSFGGGGGSVSSSSISSSASATTTTTSPSTTSAISTG